MTDPAVAGAGPRRCAVLGSPISHSLSPVLHRAAYAALGLDWSYEAVELREPELAGFLGSLDRSWRGLSLTMPLKRTVVPLVDELTTAAAAAQAANTVVLDRGRRVGHNTDVPGAVAALTERYHGPLRHAVVLGGGATAASVLLALADLGCVEATLLVRDPARASETVAVASRHPRAPRLTVAPLPSRRSGTPERGPVGGSGHQATSPVAPPVAPVVAPPDVLVSTVPAAAQEEPVLELVEGAGVVFEVVYDPWPTPLATRALDRGLPLVGGLDLLVHQAARQVELMTGVARAPLAAMRAAGEAALLARSHPHRAARLGENTG